MTPKTRNEYPDPTKAERARRRYALQDVAAQRLGYDTWQKMGTAFRKAVDGAGSPEEAQEIIGYLLANMYASNTQPPQAFFDAIQAAKQANPPKKRGYKKETPA